jgi:hypothetical protein
MRPSPRPAKRRWIALALALFISTPVFADVEIVKDGVPKATIVIAKSNAGEYKEPDTVAALSQTPTPLKIQRAAKDLQDYLQKITGAKVPIVTDDQAAPQGFVILLGKSALTKDHADKIPSGVTSNRAEEGYVILAKGNTLLLAGNDEGPYRGTEYAVADFLRSQGVRWYMPGPYGEVVPTKKSIVIPDGLTKGTPGFKMRNWWGAMSPKMHSDMYHFKLRNGLNPMLHFVAIPSDSSIRSVLPPVADLNKPEYADVFGKDEHGKPHPGMPNLTSDKSVEYAVGKIKEYVKQNPQYPHYGIGADDGFPRDYSPATVKTNLNFPDVGGRLAVPGENSATEEWMVWVDKVYNRLQKDLPGHGITTNGYANRNTPPQGITFNPNIWVMFAGIWSDTIHAYDNPRSWQTLRQGKMIEQWAKVSNNVYMYNYTYYMLGSAGSPIPLARKHAHDMPLYKKWGVVGFSNEGRYACAEQGIFANYLMFRMMWDPSLDPAKLADEFYPTWYGPAAKPIRAFWDTMEETIETTNMLGHEDRIMPYVHSQDEIKKLEPLIAEAEKLATAEPFKTHVLADRLILDHLKAYMAMHEAEFAADFPQAVKQAQIMLDLRKKLSDISIGYFDFDPATQKTMGLYYWDVQDRLTYYQKMADLTTGKTGSMVAVLPEKARFATDPRDEGRFFDWYQPDFKDSFWNTLSTTVPFYAQGYRDQQNYPYLGAMWYRLNVDVPASAQGKTVRLYAPACEVEAWVWVNGQFVGHMPYNEAYVRPLAIDFDVTKALKPGEKNSIVVRVHTHTNAAQQSAGMTSRLFLYAPNPVAAQPAK